MKALILLSVTVEVDVDEQCPLSDVWYKGEDAKTEIIDALDTSVYDGIKVEVSLIADMQED
jgi:hypothetical protein